MHTEQKTGTQALPRLRAPAAATATPHAIHYTPTRPSCQPRTAALSVPHDPELEAAALGCYLIDPEQLRLHRPSPDLFYRAEHQAICAALLALDDQGAPIDALTLTHALRDAGCTDVGTEELVALMNAVPSALHLEGYVERLRALAARREMLYAARALAQAAAHDADPQAVLAEALERLTQAQARSQPEAQRTRWAADHLLAAAFPEPQWLVPGLIPEGLAVLAGLPKIGKSWLALQIALAVGTGGTLFGRAVPQRKVLFLALEDSERRLQARLRAMGWPAGTTVEFAFAWPDLLRGGLTALSHSLAAEGYGLVVVDTIGRAAALDICDPVAVTEVYAGLQQLAFDHQATVLLVDHTRKNGTASPDVILDTLGSVRKGGAADVALGLFRAREPGQVTLQVVGREVERAELVLRFDAERRLWECVGTAREVARSDAQQEVLEALEALGGEATTSQIAEYLGGDRGNISRALKGLCAQGQVKRLGHTERGVPYRLAAPRPTTQAGMTPPG